MEQLGEDEIFSIFERISNEEDKKSFALLCKAFLKVACFQIRSLCTRSPDSLYNMLIASPKMVSFTCYKSFSNNHMKLIAESCPNIKHLILYNEQWLDDHKVGKLEFDDVGLCAITNACSHLVEVKLDGKLHFKEIGIGSLVRSCKNLRILSLNFCVNVTDKSLNMIGHATRLGKLELFGCCLITDLGLEYLANGHLKHCLETLDLGYCNRITDNGIIHLKKLVCLRDLCLYWCGANITDNGVVALCELPDLKILHLDFLINITDKSLREIGSKCLKMSMLNLEGCEKITCLGLHALSDLHELSSLTLVSCYKLSWEDIKSTVFTCQNMSYLYLSSSIKKPMPDPGCSEDYYLVSGNKCKIMWI